MYTGTLTLLLIAKFQDEIENKPIETCFFSSVRLFYHETVKQCLQNVHLKILF